MTPDYSKPIIATASGGYVDLADPDPATLFMTDIAAALSKICRYTGHCSRFYSVAEHSVRVASYLRDRGYTPATQMAGLLHDAAEAYLGDMSTPLKNIMPQYRTLEGAMEWAVMERFQVDLVDRAEIKHADLVLLAYEKKQLLQHEKNDWPVLAGIHDSEYLDNHYNAHPYIPLKGLGLESAGAETVFRKMYFRIANEPTIPKEMREALLEAI